MKRHILVAERVIKSLPRRAVGLCCMAATLTMISCGTFFANRHPDVEMHSDPDGAKVFVDGDFVGTTPVQIRLLTNKEYKVEFRKDGFQTRIFYLGRHAGRAWIVLDLLAGGLLPIIVDAATGGWYELDDHHVGVVLQSS
jgi:hypothetical protein